MVSVRWVITMPSTASSASSSLMRLAICSHTSIVILKPPSLQACSSMTLACWLTCGTVCSNSEISMAPGTATCQCPVPFRLSRQLYRPYPKDILWANPYAPLYYCSFSMVAITSLQRSNMDSTRANSSGLWMREPLTPMEQTTGTLRLTAAYRIRPAARYMGLSSPNPSSCEVTLARSNKPITWAEVSALHRFAPTVSLRWCLHNVLIVHDCAHLGLNAFHFVQIFMPQYPRRTQYAGTALGTVPP